MALGRRTTWAFEKLTTRLSNLAGGWSEKMLNSAGRAVLIKVVMQAIPTYRVLAGKYFHNTDFMKAKKKKNSSHVWQAILKGRATLHLGLMKRIGDGKSTNIWKMNDSNN